MRGLYAIARLIRPGNCVMAGLGVWLGAHLAGNGALSPQLIAAALCGSCICAGGNILNDLLDLPIDRVSHPDRVLIRGLISTRTAMATIVLFDLIGLVLSTFVSLLLVLVALGSTTLLITYNFWLKRIPLVGNLVIGLLGGLTLMTGGLAVKPEAAFALPGPLVGAVFACLMHVVREIVKDVQDVGGDREAGVLTFPQVIGEKGALWTGTGIFGILCILIYISVRAEWYGPAYSIIVLLGVVVPFAPLIAATAFKPSAQRNRYLSGGLKIGMALGMLALALG